jgi:hypothetical protein
MNRRRLDESKTFPAADTRLVGMMIAERAIGDDD